MLASFQIPWRLEGYFLENRGEKRKRHILILLTWVVLLLLRDKALFIYTVFLSLLPKPLLISYTYSLIGLSLANMRRIRLTLQEFLTVWLMSPHALWDILNMAEQIYCFRIFLFNLVLYCIGLNLHNFYLIPVWGFEKTRERVNICILGLSILIYCSGKKNP